MFGFQILDFGDESSPRIVRVDLLERDKPAILFHFFRLLNTHLSLSTADRRASDALSDSTALDERQRDRALPRKVGEVDGWTGAEGCERRENILCLLRVLSVAVMRSESGGRFEGATRSIARWVDVAWSLVGVGEQSTAREVVDQLSERRVAQNVEHGEVQERESRFLGEREPRSSAQEDESAGAIELPVKVQKQRDRVSSLSTEIQLPTSKGGLSTSPLAFFRPRLTRL